MDVKESSSKLPETALNALSVLNNVDYKMPPELGITRNRTHQQDLFQRNTYTGGEMVLIAQTGSALVDPKDSWLSFVLTMASDTTGTMGVGSAANVIDEILIESRTGRDLCRVREAGLWIKNYQDWTRSANWKATEGIAQGYAKKIDFTETGATQQPTDGTVRYCIPMRDLAPVFNPIGDKLLPAQLMEGMRIRIRLASANVAVVGSTAKTFTITDPRVTWSVVDLTDQFKRKLQEIAASRGLALMHKEIHQQQVSDNNTVFNYNVNKAVARGIKVCVIPRVVANIGSTTAGLDSYSSEIYLFSQLQARIGNSYFPQAPLISLTAADFRETYKYTYDAFGYDKAYHKAPVVQPVTEPGGYGSTNVANSKALWAVSLNKSGVNDLDGYTINNSRSLVMDVRFSASATRRLDTFLQYLRALMIFTSNVDVKD